MFGYSIKSSDAINTMVSDAVRHGLIVGILIGFVAMAILLIAVYGCREYLFQAYMTVKRFALYPIYAFTVAYETVAGLFHKSAENKVEEKKVEITEEPVVEAHAETIRTFATADAQENTN